MCVYYCKNVLSQETKYSKKKNNLQFLEGLPCPQQTLVHPVLPAIPDLPVPPACPLVPVLPACLPCLVLPACPLPV